MSSGGRFSALKATVVLELALRADGPVLVKGPEAFVPDAPDMSFIRTPTPLGAVPFLPGSSLKGVLRSAAEMLLRASGAEACDPTARETRGGCGSCPSCRTFGSAATAASVTVVGDGMPWPQGASDEEQMEAVRALERARAVRTGVAIDRRRGSVAQGPFDMEVLVGVVFYPHVLLRNPEEDDLALLAGALDLLDQGIVRLGSGTTKGLGRVRVQARGVAACAVDRAALDPLLGGLADGVERRGLLWWARSRDPQGTVAAWLRIWSPGER